MWGLDAEGKFLTGAPEVSSLLDRVKGALFKKQDVNVREAVLMDLKRIHDAVRDEACALQQTDARKHEIGKKLLFLFQCDLLPGISGKILELKGNRDSSKVKHVSFQAKVAAWAFLLLMNVGMLFYILLFALTQTGPRQNAWFQSFALWLVVEILLVSTAIVFITHILVPSLIMKDITQIKRRLMDNIRDFNDKVHSDQPTDKKESAEDSENVSFNAANYLFVSTRLARQFPDLKESKIIAQFSTPWPRQSYLHVQNVSKKYSKKFSAFTRSASILLIFFVGNFLSVPPACQDIIVQMTSTTAIGYLVLIHVQLFEIFPALVILPALVLVVLAHFIIQSSKADAKIKLARLFPASTKQKKANQIAPDPMNVEEAAAEPESAPVDSDVDSEFELSEEDEDDFDSSNAVAQVPVAVAQSRVGHQTRRQSIQTGLGLLQAITEEQKTADSIDRGGLSCSGSSGSGSSSSYSHDSTRSSPSHARAPKESGLASGSSEDEFSDSDSEVSEIIMDVAMNSPAEEEDLHLPVGSRQSTPRTLERQRTAVSRNNSGASSSLRSASGGSSSASSSECMSEEPSHNGTAVAAAESSHTHDSHEDSSCCSESEEEKMLEHVESTSSDRDDWSEFSEEQDEKKQGTAVESGLSDPDVNTHGSDDQDSNSRSSSGSRSSGTCSLVSDSASASLSEQC